MAPVEVGSGRPVVALADAAFARSKACAALATRFRVICIGAHDAAAWIAAQGFDSVGLLAFGGDAPAALQIAAGLPQAALVLVSPSGLLTDDPDLRERRRAVEAPKCVLVGGRDAGQPPGALGRYRTELAHANVVLVYDAGADIAADRPEAFAAAAGDFLDRQGRFQFMTESMAIAR